MNQVSMLIAGLVLSASAHAGDTAILSSEFRGRSADGSAIIIEQGAGDKMNVVRIAPCRSFPCRVADVTTKIEVSAKFLTGENMQDGNTEIQLGKNMQLVYVNNGLAGTKSYWEFAMTKANGEVETITLEFSPLVHRR